MPEAVKTAAREIADWILTQPGFEQEKEKYLQAHLGVTQMYIRDRPIEINRTMNRAYEDLQDRIAQDVLKAAVYRQRMDKEAQFHEKIPRHQLINSFWKGVWISIQREKTKSEYQARVMQAQLKQEERRKEGRQR